MTVPGWRQVGTEGDESSKPEDHGDTFHDRDSDTLRKVWEVNWRKRKIGRGNEGSPNAIEEHEIDR